MKWIWRHIIPTLSLINSYFQQKHVQNKTKHSSTVQVRNSGRSFPKTSMLGKISSCARLLDQTADFGVFHPHHRLGNAVLRFLSRLGFRFLMHEKVSQIISSKKKQQSRLSLSSFDDRNLLVFFQAVDAAAWGLSATASTELRLGRPTGAANQDEINYMAQQTCTSKGSYFFVQQSFHELMARRLCRTTQRYEPWGP